MPRLSFLYSAVVLVCHFLFLKGDMIQATDFVPSVPLTVPVAISSELTKQSLAKESEEKVGQLTESKASSSLSPYVLDMQRKVAEFLENADLESCHDVNLIIPKFRDKLTNLRKTQIAFMKVFGHHHYEFDSLKDLPFYEYFFASRILVLSDGSAKNGLAERLSKKIPHALIVKTDFSYHEADSGVLVEFPKIFKMRMDNTKRFPFGDDSFDLIVAKSSICECQSKGATMCCGPVASVEGKMKFLEEIIRVLNKNSLQATILLHANEEMLPLSKKSIEEWTVVFAEIQKKHGDIPFTFEFWDVGQKVQGISIKMQ